VNVLDTGKQVQPVILNEVKDLELLLTRSFAALRMTIAAFKIKHIFLFLDLVVQVKLTTTMVSFPLVAGI